MKCTIPEISWHNRDPILAADIQHNSLDGIYRLVTAGTDNHVGIWQLRVLDTGGVSVESLCDLTKHNRAVNAVRFSPDGTMLASCDDEASLIVWKKNEVDGAPMDIFGEDAKENKESWTVFKMLRGHLEDISDLCWSSCSSYLISGSVDNTAIMWDVAKGRNIGLLTDHKGFVQGVAWDPRGQFVLTLGSDRCLRFFNISNKKVVARVSKYPFPKDVPKSLKLDDQEKQTKLFYDDTLKSFCRRLSFSPDGEVIVAPTAILEIGGTKESKHTNGTLVFSRHQPQKPVMFLPTGARFTISARFCPLKFKLNPIPKEKNPDEENIENQKEETEEWKTYRNMFNLPYRMIFAVATQNYVLLYDTQQPMPFAKISNIHYTRLSDLSWSGDAMLLVISSTDGYCSLVSFDEGELGEVYDEPEGVTPQVPANVKDNFKKPNNKQTKAEKMDIDQPKQIKPKLIEIKRKSDAKPIEVKAMPIQVKKSSDNKNVKRIPLITVSKETSIKPPAVTQDSDTNKEKENKSDESEAMEVDVEPNISEVKLKENEVDPKINQEESKTSDSIPNKSETSTSDQENKSKVEELKEIITKSPIKNAIKTPRRVSLITISSPKDKKKSAKDGNS